MPSLEEKQARWLAQKESFNAYHAAHDVGLKMTIEGRKEYEDVVYKALLEDPDYLNAMEDEI